MRAVVQKVINCSVKVEEEYTGKIDRGLLIYLGVSSDDTREDADYLAEKIVNLRIYEDHDGKMNLSIAESCGHEVLVVSQFTLYGDARKGRRPSFSKAARHDKGETLYEYFMVALEKNGFKPKHGAFGELMHVNYTNIGPLTILLDSSKLF